MHTPVDVNTNMGAARGKSRLSPESGKIFPAAIMEGGGLFCYLFSMYGSFSYIFLFMGCPFPRFEAFLLLFSHVGAILLLFLYVGGSFAPSPTKILRAPMNTNDKCVSLSSLVYFIQLS